jgi:tetratricopeptide (TPR) repeat protein
MFNNQKSDEGAHIPTNIPFASNPHHESLEEAPSSTPLSQTYLAEAATEDMKSDLQSQSRADEIRGRSADVLGNTSDAMQYYDEAIRTNPQNVSARTSKAELLAEQGSYEQAASELEDGLSAAPGDVALLVKLSDTYMFGTKEPEKAIAPLIQANQMHPGDGYLYLLLADVYIATNQFDQAKLALQSISDPSMTSLVTEKYQKLELIKP